MNKESIVTIRIRLLCKFLDLGGGTLALMLDWINQRLQDASHEPIGKRTLQATIELLRKGNFNHSLQDVPRSQRGQLFRVKVVGKRYEWEQGTQKPVFGDLDEDERFTLPFIASILNKYQNIPAVRKVLTSLPELLGVSQEEMQSAAWVIHSGPMLYDGLKKQPDFAERVIGLVIKILGHIHRREKIEFHYAPVNILSSKLENKTYHAVAPVHIRFYEELYYLTAVDEKKRRITNFRIDQIVNLRVDVLVDDEDELPVSFDLAAIHQHFKLEEHFRNILGIWSFDSDTQVYLIRIRFNGWAASNLLKVRYHPTQEIESIDDRQDFCIVRFRLKLTPAVYPDQPIVERSSELSFLLGRFRTYAVPLDAVPTLD